MTNLVGEAKAKLSFEEMEQGVDTLAHNSHMSNLVYAKKAAQAQRDRLLKALETNDKLLARIAQLAAHLEKPHVVDPDADEEFSPEVRKVYDQARLDYGPK